MRLRVVENYKTFNIIWIGIFVAMLSSMIIFGFNLSIDFTGGSVVKFESELENTQELITNAANKLQVDRFNVEENSPLYELRTNVQEEDLSFTLIEKIQENLDEQDRSKITQTSFDLVGTSLGQETIKKAIYALITAFIGILIFITYAFRNVPDGYSSFKFGLSAIVAMFYDVFFTLGIFAVLGAFFSIEIDLMFVTAVLTVIGYSVNDTIIIFDRIRENLGKYRKKLTFVEIVDKSINETLRRSLGTVFTVIIVLLALLVYGAVSTRFFVLALLVGIASGAYSSIFVASPALTYLHSGKPETTIEHLKTQIKKIRKK